MAVLPDMVGIVVADMGRALAFYRLLGLDIPAGNDSEPFVEYTTPNGYRLSWNALSMVQEIDPDWKEPAGNNRVALAFKCEGGPTEVDAVYHRLIAAGYAGHKDPWDAFWGQRYAVVLDPDGNTVDIFAPLSG